MPGSAGKTGKMLLIIAFVGSRTHGRGTFPSPEKYPKGRRGIPPVPQFTGVSNRILLNLQLLCRLIRFLSSNLQRVCQRCFGLRPRRHKLRIPHPAASVRLRSLRCASFFLGKRSAGLPRSGPVGPFSSHIGLSAMLGGFQRGRCPLWVVAGVGFIGEGPHRKGPAPMRLFGYFLSVQKVTRGVGPGRPHITGIWGRRPRRVKPEGGAL